MKFRISGLVAAAVVGGMIPAASPAQSTPTLSSPAAFNQCKACHVVVKGQKPTIGPNLFGVVGSKAGARADYMYSPALKGSGITWTTAQIEAFIAAPQQVVRGTKMSFFGERDAAKRRAIVAYLSGLK
jgi:cytochrome c